jgi:hypothetical protein
MVSAKTTKDGVRCEVLTAVLLMFHIFWDVTLSLDIWFLMFIRIFKGQAVKDNSSLKCQEPFAKLAINRHSITSQKIKGLIYTRAKACDQA